MNPIVIDALYSINTTSYDNSFASRIHGNNVRENDKLIAVDWETRTPWMELMTDVIDHYSFAQCGFVWSFVLIYYN